MTVGKSKRNACHPPNKSQDATRLRKGDLHSLHVRLPLYSSAFNLLLPVAPYLFIYLFILLGFAGVAHLLLPHPPCRLCQRRFQREPRIKSR